MAVNQRRGAFTLLEVLFGLTLGLILWGVIFTMMRAESRIRENVDARLDGENIPAVLHRHLSRDLSRVPLMAGADAVKITENGRALELRVQVAPAKLEKGQLDLPVKIVRYRMTGRGTVLREEAGQRDVLPVEGLARLGFVREPAVKEGAQDMLRVTGALEARGGAARAEFSLAFPVGARKAGPVRWSSIVKAGS